MDAVSLPYAQPVPVRPGLPAEWREAIRGLRDNPLLKYYQHVEERRFSRLTWLQRRFWLIPLIAALIVVGVVEAMEAAQGESGLFGVGAGSALHMLISPLLLSALICLYLAFARMFAGCYGLLAASTTHGDRLHLDEMVCVTNLSHADIVAGAVRHYLPVTLRMLALSVGVGMLWLFVAADEPDWKLFARLLGAALFSLLLGGLTSAFYAFAWISMGRGRRLNMDFGWVFVLQLILWTALAWGAATVSSSLRDFYMLSGGSGGDYADQYGVLMGETLAIGLTLLSVGALLLIRAASAAWARALVALCLPLALTALFVARSYEAGMQGGSDVGTAVTMAAVYDSAAFTPLPFALVASVEDVSYYYDGYYNDDADAALAKGYAASVRGMYVLTVLGLLAAAVYSSTLSVKRHRRGMT